jgi:hypothetical protein
MWIISKKLADSIIGKNYAANAVYNPVEVDGVFLISEIEKKALIAEGLSEDEFTIYVESLEVQPTDQ